MEFYKKKNYINYMESIIHYMESIIGNPSNGISESFLNKYKFFLARYIMKWGPYRDLNKDKEAFAIFKSFLGHPIYGKDAEYSISKMKTAGRLI